jgi:NAD-dependent DNA ligase
MAAYNGGIQIMERASMQDLKRSSVGDLKRLQGIGPKRAQSIINFLESVYAGSPSQSQLRRARCIKTAPGVPAEPELHARRLEHEMWELMKVIREAREAYYTASGGSGVVINDSEYDALVAQLRAAAEAAHACGLDSVRDVDAFLNSVGSPVPSAGAAARRRGRGSSQQLVQEDKSRSEAGETSEASPKRETRLVPHTEARGGELLSLASVHSVEELRSWWERAVVANVGDVPIVVEPKVDGLTMRVSYESGKLVEVSTVPCRFCLPHPGFPFIRNTKDPSTSLYCHLE